LERASDPRCELKITPSLPADDLQTDTPVLQAPVGPKSNTSIE
jgi:hypothetical protein